VRPWQRLVGRRPIVTRLVVAVAAAMAAILLATSAFVYWRVSVALNRQLDQDLKAWRAVVAGDLRTGDRPPMDLPGLTYQLFDAKGQVTGGNTAIAPLADRTRLHEVTRDRDLRYDIGGFIPPPRTKGYRVQLETVQTHTGRVVVASAISRSKHDEALRELLLQLGIAGLLALVGASVVGYRAARAALNPVESYRRAAQQASVDRGGRLPVADRRDDELTRLGHTFNDLLEDIEDGATRERQFLADASHELRTPLALMSTELEWARHRPRSATELDDVLTSLQGQVTRLVDLTDALLDVEELRAVGSLTREEVPLRELVDDAVRHAVARPGDVIVQVPEVRVFVDQRWMSIAVANLLRNAYHHGCAPVSVTATWSDPQLLLTVRDAGPGFPEDFRDAAFDRFSRADQSRTTPGSGLGLHLVGAVAKAHHGQARIVDTPAGAAVEIAIDAGRPEA
jgi:signal transduction histidine kinase